MAPSPSAHTGWRRRKFHRALAALPLLALPALMGRGFAVGAGTDLGDRIEKMVRDSAYDWNGVSAPLITSSFYGVPGLDQTVGFLATAFATLQFDSGRPEFWQLLVFLVDFGALYAVMMLEACRRDGNTFLVRYPFFTCLAAQLGGVGVFAPLYFFAAHVYSPASTTAANKLASTTVSPKNYAYALAILPSLALGYYLPLLPTFFHPELEGRNYWNWLWQPFPVWVSAMWLPFSWFVSTTQGASTEPETKRRFQNASKVILGTLILVSTCMYWYTLVTSGFTFSAIFVPRYLVESPTQAAVALQTIIQYDHICTFLAAFVWLAHTFGDLSAAGVAVPWIKMLAAVPVIATLGGPGSLVALGWLVKEELQA